MSLLKTGRNKIRAKSQKDKVRNAPAQLPTISGPANTIVRQPGEGLYLKLTQHQKNIATQLKFISAALQDNGHTQYRSRHKKMDLTAVVTELLVQLDCAVTTTHQCLTKDILGKDSSIKPELENQESKIYLGIAFIVRWIDFDSKGVGREMPQEREQITETIKMFEVALAEVVRLVYQCQLQNGITSTPANHQRRSSVDNSAIHSIHRSKMISGSPVVGGLEDFMQQQRGHPTVEQLRMESNSRKTSWAPNSPNSPGLGPFRNKASTLMPMTTYSRDSGLSEGSSGGASDEEKRRSGSSDHNLSGGQSPEHSAYGRESSSPDWDSNRQQQQHQGTHKFPTTAPIPISAPLGPEPLPSLPGEAYYALPPTLPRREGDEDEIRSNPRPSLPLKLQNEQQVNGHLSPDSAPGHAHSTVEETDGGELPPPVPIKKRHAAVQQAQQLNGSGNEEAPPPVPVKVRRSTVAGQRGSVSSPTTTPTHAAYSFHRPIHSSASVDVGVNSVDLGVRQGLGLELPPVPVRMESIPGVKTALVQDTPPPKPPRNDRPPSIEVASPQHLPKQMPTLASRQIEEMNALNAVRKYNEDIRKAQETGPDAIPPVPLKKKTIMIYKGLVDGYTYDESITQPLYIPGMEAPPPIPPKKRRKKPAEDLSSSSVSESSSPQVQAGRTRLKSSSEDLEEAADVEVNYLECEEATAYLVFNKEESGGYTLKGGPIDALIAYAASSARSVKHYSEAFLLTYYTFITPGELIDKLLYRLKYFYQSGIQAIWQATTSLLVRVLTGLKQPIPKEAQMQLIDVVHHMITNGNLKFAQLLRNALVEKLNQLMTESSPSLSLGVAFQSTTQRKVSIMDFSAENIARQMTILDNELFQKVDVCEMLYWAKEQSEEKSPMLTQFTLHFNNVSQWTKATLLKRGLDMKYRCKLMMHFIGIMKSLLETFNNFNSYLAILSAIESSPISRLDWTDKILKGLEEPRQLIDNRGSFKNYREAFAHAKPPCIPYIGLYLQDLTFIEMQPSKLEEDPSAINFTKRWKQFKSVDHIRFAQTKQYIYDPDPELLNLFKNFEVKETDEDLWAISTEIKPSNRTMRTNQS